MEHERLTPAEKRLLYVMQPGKTYAIVEIARLLNLSEKSIAHLWTVLNRLQDRGLIYHAPNQHEDRMITAAGIVARER